ncbi:MAG: Fe-S cluster assembly sulfur transfer protein SufU [Candidatus Hodarchaeales archaeon]|jgi:nitrogen fixation NifU-like protein
MSNIYSEMILEYYKHPKNKGSIINADISHFEHNPLCGDKLKIDIKLDDEKNTIKDIKFDGVGCAISQASASILTLLVKGKTLKEIVKFDKEELLETLGIKLSPNRLKCGLLGLDTLKAGVREFIGENLDQPNLDE